MSDIIQELRSIKNSPSQAEHAPSVSSISTHSARQDQQIPSSSIGEKQEDAEVLAEFFAGMIRITKNTPRKVNIGWAKGAAATYA